MKTIINPHTSSLLSIRQFKFGKLPERPPRLHHGGPSAHDRQNPSAGPAPPPSRPAPGCDQPAGTARDRAERGLQPHAEADPGHRYSGAGQT